MNVHGVLNHRIWRLGVHHVQELPHRTDERSKNYEVERETGSGKVLYFSVTSASLNHD
jgi:hypothetical protein